MERTSPSSSTATVKMTTGDNKSNSTNGASIVTNTLGELSSSSSHLSSLTGTIAKKIATSSLSSSNKHSTNNNTTTHVEYLTKLIQKVDKREAAAAADTNNSSNDTSETTHQFLSYAPSANSARNKKPCIDSLDSSITAFNKLEICDTIKCLTETSCKDDSSEKVTVDVISQQKLKINSQPIYEPISKKLNNMQRIKGIEYTLNNKHNTSPNNDHSLTTKCDNNVTCITSLPPHIKILPKTQSLDIVDDDASASCIVVNNRMSNVNVVVHNNSSVGANEGTLEMKGTIPRLQAGDQSRPIYPSLNFSPYASPFSSPRTGRRRAPLRESRRVSIEQNGSFLFLNQYKLMDEIGQVNNNLQFSLKAPT